MHYFGLLRYLPYFLPSALHKSQSEIAEIGRDKLTRRILKGVCPERKDFMSFILQKYDPAKDWHELENLTTILLVGGSETTATLLSGLTYYLLTNSRVYEKLKREIRSSFLSEDDITLIRVAGLPYMKVVIDEALRLYPPTPISLPRIVPGNGEMIQGRFVPGGVCRLLNGREPGLTTLGCCGGFTILSRSLGIKFQGCRPFCTRAMGPFILRGKTEIRTR